jgi:histidine kinase 2/3/4 (cytokinin receptor)
VKMMNGELTVNSTPEEGSVFEFTLTLGYAEPACMENLGYVKSVQQPAITEEQKLRGTRVILVDTHPVRQEASASYLRRLGIIVEDARDIQSTLDILRRYIDGAAP